MSHQLFSFFHFSGFFLGILGFCALYSTLGLTIFLIVGCQSCEHADGKVDVELYFLAFLYLGKEVILLFSLLTQVIMVNDEADSVVPHLIMKPWGAPFSIEEVTRQDLLALATTFAVNPEAELSMWNYFTKPPIEPIAFSLAGTRLTKGYLVVTFLVVAFSFVEFSVHSELHDYFAGHDDDGHSDYGHH